ncbi:MAG: hypothetical protein RsTaC01_1072 [Candidatus Paraimprobicoccus trichonymphae]|uniref:Uncharacterized protein n=1 Tax=Candidatus Paraimprobicoccus trichonymphae TaxID=3033793 RepID=A0AA48I0E9_9FIRM|nr:MAG: hypothetical protein RsTaC01_1072 [Candidatus Paraimprobicoccus trichonymphae]
MFTNLKNTKIIFILCLIFIVPSKIYFSVLNSNFERTPLFAIVLILLGSLLYYSIYSNKNISNELKLRKNFFLSTISAVLCALFFICSFNYFTDKKIYSFELQPLIMFFLNILVSVSFAIISASYFSGKSKFNGANSFFVFIPSIMYIINIIFFVLVTSGKPNQYDVALKCLISMVFLYSTQFFVNSTKKNIKKMLLIFGMLTILVSLMHNIPNLISYKSLSRLDLILNLTELTVCLYTAFIILEIRKNLFKNHTTII